MSDTTSQSLSSSSTHSAATPGVAENSNAQQQQPSASTSVTTNTSSSPTKPQVDSPNVDVNSLPSEASSVSTTPTHSPNVADRVAHNTSPTADGATTPDDTPKPSDRLEKRISTYSDAGSEEGVDTYELRQRIGRSQSSGATQMKPPTSITSSNTTTSTTTTERHTTTTTTTTTPAPSLSSSASILTAAPTIAADFRPIRRTGSVDSAGASLQQMASGAISVLGANAKAASLPTLTNPSPSDDSNSSSATNNNATPTTTTTATATATSDSTKVSEFPRLSRRNSKDELAMLGEQNKDKDEKKKRRFLTFMWGSKKDKSEKDESNGSATSPTKDNHGNNSNTSATTTTTSTSTSNNGSSSGSAPTSVSSTPTPAGSASPPTVRERPRSVTFASGEQIQFVAFKRDDRDRAHTITLGAEFTMTTTNRAEPHPNPNDPYGNVRREILDTEKDYVNDLHLIKDLFFMPMKQRQLLSQQELQMLFSNILDILNLNKLLLVDLMEGKKSIGEIFLYYTEYFKLYTTYCADQEKAFLTFKRLQESKSSFRAFLKEVKLNEKSRKLPLDSFLMTPIQRICRYPLLLGELVKHSPPDNPEHDLLLKAKIKVAEVVSTIDERKKHIENTRSVFRVAESLHNYKAPLANPGREYLEETDSFELDVEGKMHAIHLFLFNDLILITKVHRSLTLTSNRSAPKKFAVVAAFVGDSTCAQLENNNTRISLTSSEVKKACLLSAKAPLDLTEWYTKFRKVARLEDKPNSRRTYAESINLERTGEDSSSSMDNTNES